MSYVLPLTLTVVISDTRSNHAQKINQIFGYRSGLGFSLLTFDWTQIAYIGSPLATPCTLLAY